MEKKIFISRLKAPTPTSSNARTATVRRSKSMTDLSSKLKSTFAPIVARNLPITKSTLSLKPPPAIHKVTSKSQVNIKPAAKRPGPAIDVVDSVKPKLPKQSKPAPYDYKARYNLLNERHTTLVQNFKDAKQKLSDVEKQSEQLNELRKEFAELQDKYTEAVNGKKKFEREYNNAASNLQQTKSENEILINENKRLSDHLQKITQSYKEVTAANVLCESQLSSALSKIEELEEIVVELKGDFKSHDELRRNLHNQIQDLKGTIRVFCRIRPSLPSEEVRFLCNINCIDENTLDIKKSKENINNITGKLVDTKMEFTFDKVFPGEASQADIFEELAQLVQSALDGYNICVFAYGQTGSGKTYTMQGECTTDALGMIPRSVILIFDLIRELQKRGWTYEVQCNFLEIYNETIRDLLNPNCKVPHDIHYNEGRGITVTNIINRNVNSAEELLGLIEIANKNRAVAVTNFNEHSSRSHSVTRITLTGQNIETSTCCNGSLNLVDLAGSESAKTSCTERMTETKNINKSLSMLGSVISALHNKECHIPYRNSKLTYLLQSSLCGNAKALMFVNIAPLDECYGESISSLRFAAKVKEIKMNAKRNKLYLKKDG